ncbi:MAG: hypothetical protein ACXWFB_06420 [Nitrososphaeraceae archaeon]
MYKISKIESKPFQVGFDFDQYPDITDKEGFASIIDADSGEHEVLAGFEFVGPSGYDNKQVMWYKPYSNAYNEGMHVGNETVITFYRIATLSEISV